MAYQPKPGQGTLYRNKNATSDKAPAYKGFHIMPDGTVLGLAMWKIELEGGTILSLKTDDGEAKYWAKKHGRHPHLAESSGDDSEPAQRREVQPRNSDRQRDRYSDNGGGQSRHSAGGSRHSQQQSRHTEDFDDDVPF